MQSKITKESFKSQSFYVGIDYHKKNWKVTILGEKYEHKTMSQIADPEILVNYLKHQNTGAANYQYKIHAQRDDQR